MLSSSMLTQQVADRLYNRRRTIVFDRCRMPKTVSTGGNTAGETWFQVLRCLNAAKDIQFEFPSFGLFNLVDVKTIQKSEQAWPNPFTLSATLDVTVAAMVVSAFASPTLTPTAASLLNLKGQSMVAHQFKSEGVTVTVSLTATALDRATSIAVNATTVYMRKDGLLPVSGSMGTRYLRLSADVPIGSTTIPVYPANGAITDAASTATLIYYGKGIYFACGTSGSSLNREALITDNTTTTLTLAGGWTSMNAGDTFEIRALHALTFGGQTTVTVNGANPVSDPLGITTVVDQNYRLRTFVTGGPWPIDSGFRTAEDVGATCDFVLGGYSNGLATGPYSPCASYGTPIGTPRKVVTTFGDSKTTGIGDLQQTQTPGYQARASNGLFALHNLACGGEGGWCGMNEGKRVFRTRMMQFADTIYIAYGTNDVLDGTPLTLTQMQQMTLAWYNAAIASGCKDVVFCTIGPLTTTVLQGQFFGQEASQVTVQAALCTAYDDWLVNTASTWQYARTFDLRTAIGLPGNTNKWKTFPSVYSGSDAGTSTTVISDANIPANAQVLWASYGIALLHSGTTYYQSVKQDIAHTEGQLTLTGALGATPTAGDTYSIFPIASLDGTHPVAYGYAQLAAALAAFGVSRA